MSVATQQKHPTLAEIVREVTDDGRRIAEFYLGVADGSLEGFEDRHRMSAARRLDKIAPGLVAEYLLKYANAQVRPSMRGSRFPMGRISPMKKEMPDGGDQAPRGPNPFQRRLAQLVREETGDGRAIVYFMAGVMHGTLLGFKPHHRLEAAKELASYITNTPSPLTGESWEPALSLPKSLPRTRYGGEGDSLPTPREPAPAQAGVPEKSGTHPIPSAEAPSVSTGNPEPETKNLPSAPSASSAVNPKPKTRSFPPITIEEIELANYDSRHITRCKFARDEITGAIYAFDEQGPFEVDEDGVSHYVSPDLIVGYGNVYQTFEDGDLEDRPVRKRSGMRLITGPPHDSPDPKDKEDDEQDKPAPVELTPAERRIRQKLKDHWHGPDPWAAPLDSAHPGRSPPW